MLTLIAFVLALSVLAVLAMRFGAESRPGFTVRRSH
jgi:hypothetical protein